MPVGTLVRVPPLVIHGFRNGSDAEVRYLNFHEPGTGFADFLRALRDGRPRTYDQHSPPSDGKLHAEPGTWVQVPPGVPHTFTLPDNGPVRFLNAHTPSCGFGTFLRGLDDAPSGDEPAAVRATFDQEPAPLWPSASAQ